MLDSECVMAVILEKGHRPCQWSLIRRQFPPHPQPSPARGERGFRTSGLGRGREETRNGSGSGGANGFVLIFHERFEAGNEFPSADPAQ